MQRKRHQIEFACILALVCSLQVALLSCSDATCEETATCANGGSSSGNNPDGADREVDANVPDVPPPEDCIQEADAKDAPQCVVDTFALFVDAAGNDNNPGTKDKPLQRIQTALERAPTKGLRRVYVCGIGPFPEHLKPPSAVHIFGGFTCGSWTYAEGTRAKVAPAESGFVLHLDGIAALTRVSDLDLVAPDLSAATDGASSIAVFVSSSNASFLRTSIVAGNGAKGTTPQPSGNGSLDSVSSGMNVLDGNPATMGTTPGSAKTCTCSNSGTNEKSMGGNGGMVALDGTSGRPLGGGGSAGLGGVDCSTQNGNGGNGSGGAGGASAIKIDILGSFRADGWFPAKGNDAIESGKPGHGGGGGGGRNGSNAGGGGACGGCGGLPGKGGTGGGASIGVLSFTSSVLIRASNVTAKAGGIGGGGGSGGPGQSGGAGAGGSTLGCLGGSGGMGGAGGHGGGGAGGISFGILYSGTKPDSDAPILQGSIGAGGPSGGTASNAGPPGVVGDVKDATQL